MVSRGPLSALIALLGGLASCTASVERVQMPKLSSDFRLPSVPPPLPEYVVRLPARNNAASRFELGAGKVGIVTRGELVLDARGAVEKQLDDGGASIARKPSAKAAVVAFCSGVVRLSLGAELRWRAHAHRAERGTRLCRPWSCSSCPMTAACARSDRATGKLARPSARHHELATADDGTAVAITHGARAFVTRDKGSTWTRHHERVQRAVDVPRATARYG
jgi:hypothetical protein